MVGTRPLCPSCLHHLPIIRAGGMVFCTLEQRLTNPHRVCQHFAPTPDTSRELVREHQRHREAFRCRGGV